jgi:hypothetical protein
LGTLLLLLVPLAVGLTYYGWLKTKRQQAVNAYLYMCSKGVDISVNSRHESVIFFKNRNVVDEDLEKFVPAFSEYAPGAGIARLVGMHLNGSSVSSDAIYKFRQVVPHCNIQR